MHNGHSDYIEAAFIKQHLNHYGSGLITSGSIIIHIIFQFFTEQGTGLLKDSGFICTVYIYNYFVLVN